MTDERRRLVREARLALPAVANQVGIIVIAFSAVTLLLFATGYDPLAVFEALGRSVTRDLGGTIRWATPLILTGLAASLAFRGGALNIGVDGQIYIGGAFAAVVALGPAATLPAALGITLTLLAGVCGGVLWAFIPAFLRVRFGALEVVTTILLISVASLLVDFLVLGPLSAGGQNAATLGTDPFPKVIWLPNIIPQTQANLGIVFAIALAVVLALVFYRTTIGYELKMVGQNMRFSMYGGIDHVKVFYIAMLGSGAIGGLAAGTELLGVLHRMPSRFNPGLGFDGIVVALLARNNPIGVILAGFFFGALRTGSLNMERLTSTPRDVVDIMEGIIVLAVSAQLGFTWLRRRRRQAPVGDPGSPLAESSVESPMQASVESL